MDTNGHEKEILERELVYSVVGCALEGLRPLGHGMNEKPYENALVTEFRLRAIAFEQQPRYNVMYKSVCVGEFVPDLVVERRLIVDAKVVETIGDREYGQMLNYLRIAGLRVGLLLNFHQPKLEWKRVVL